MIDARELAAPDRRVDRALVLVAVACSPLVFTQASRDVFALPKLTLTALCAVGVLAVTVWRVLERGSLRVPRSMPIAALAAFLLLAWIAVLTSDVFWRSFVGPWGRGTGLVGYLVAACLGVAVARSATTEHIERLLDVLVAVGATIAVLGLVEQAGLDPLGVAPNGVGPVTTMGNANFTSALLGIAAPVGAWVCLRSGGTRRRALHGAAVLLIGAGILTAFSAQGVLAAGAGCAVLLFTLSQRSAHRRLLTAGLGVGGAAVALLVVLGLNGAGPISSLQDRGSQLRFEYWDAALTMVQEEPLLGVGFARYEAHFREDRRPEGIRGPLEAVTDEPHSVPLGMFTSGGLPLGLAYLAFIGTTGWVLLRGLRRLEGPSALPALGAAWVAFHVQSAVSIDVPPFPLLHLVLVGAILAVVGVEVRTLEVPFLRRTTARRRTGRRRPSPSRAGGAVALGAAVLVVAIGSLGVVRPLQASFHVGGAPAGATQRLDDLRRAADLVPWEGEYWNLLGGQFAAIEQPDLALGAFERAIDEDPRYFDAVINAARAAAAGSLLPASLGWYERAGELEPASPVVPLELGELYLDAGARDRLEGLVDEMLAEDPNDAAALYLQGELHRRGQRPEEATVAYHAALAASPRYDLDLRLRLIGAYYLLGDEASARNVVDVLLAVDSRRGAVQHIIRAVRPHDRALAAELRARFGD